MMLLSASGTWLGFMAVFLFMMNIFASEAGLRLVAASLTNVINTQLAGE